MAGVRILADLLEVVDNLDRALDAARRIAFARGAPAGRRDGRARVSRQLEGLGVRRGIDVGGAAFDRSRHEAVATVPARTPDEDGQVVGAWFAGATPIGADVLRPASVAVTEIRTDAPDSARIQARSNCVSVI